MKVFLYIFFLAIFRFPQMAGQESFSRTEKNLMSGYYNENSNNKHNLNLSGIIENKDDTVTKAYSNPHPYIKISILSPGFSIENSVSEKNSVEISVSTGFVYTGSSIENFSISRLSFKTTIGFEPRFYRKIKTENQCIYGGYFTTPIRIHIYEKQTFISASGEVGIQDLLGKKGFYNLSAGLGIPLNEEKFTLSPTGRISVGIIL